MPTGRLTRIFSLIMGLLLATSRVDASDEARGGAEAHGEIEIEAYGELRYARLDYGPDQTATPEGALPDSRATLDVPRVTVELEAALADRLDLEIEVEIEHAGAGTALELEYEEFGEYETEVESGGEVTLEQVHVTRHLGERTHVRAGRMPVPVGVSNRFGHPTEYLTSLRPESERAMIPVTWFELGLEVRAGVGPVDLRAMLVNGLDSSGFGSKLWIVGGHQRRFEEVRATDLAGVVDVRVPLRRGIDIGGAVYHGGSADNRPKPDMESVDADVTIIDAYARCWTGPWRLTASYLHGHLENAGVVSAKNSRLSVNLGVPRTPVAEGARAYAFEVGIDALALIAPGTHGTALVPFARYEAVDTMHDVSANVFDDPRFDRRIVTVGVAVAPVPNLLVKTEYAMRSLGASRFNDENTWSLGIGFRAP